MDVQRSASCLLPPAERPCSSPPIGGDYQEIVSTPFKCRHKRVLFFYTADIHYPHLGIRHWLCGKVRTNLLPRCKKVQLRQISLENCAEDAGARMAAYKLVLIRHGESSWNQENRFCGWYDADLSETGVQEAKRGGEALKGGKETVVQARPGLLSGTGLGSVLMQLQM